MYGLSNDGDIFDLWWFLKVKSQGQTLENFEVEYLENGTR